MPAPLARCAFSRSSSGASAVNLRAVSTETAGLLGRIRRLGGGNLAQRDLFAAGNSRDDNRVR